MAKPINIALVFGDGGHREQMIRLLDSGLIQNSDQVGLISFIEKKGIHHEKLLHQYVLGEARSKYNLFFSIIRFPFWFIRALFYSLLAIFKYRPAAIVSTGPGLALVPALICRLTGAKLIIIEDWCKFDEPTITTKLLAPFGQLLIVQNKSLTKRLPKATYAGRL